MQLLAPLLVIGLWITLIVGWVLNIIAIANADFSVFTGVLILRVIGVFVAPLGSIMGLFF